MSALDSFLNHPIETLEKALHLRKQIDALQEGLNALFGPTPPSLGGIQTTVTKRKGKGKRSPEVKARMAAAQRLRWAKSKGMEAAEPAAAAKAAPKARGRKKGGMSAEGRARIVAAQKARWAKVKSQKSAPAPAKAAPAAKGKKRKLSPEARARIVAAVKARWARAKKG